MESHIQYRVDRPSQSKIYPPSDKRPVILSNRYCSTAKKFMLAMIAAGYDYGSTEELCDRAIAFTDKLIERVGEKL